MMIKNLVVPDGEWFRRASTLVGIRNDVSNDRQTPCADLFLFCKTALVHPTKLLTTAFDLSRGCCCVMLLAILQQVAYRSLPGKNSGPWNDDQIVCVLREVGGLHETQKSAVTKSPQQSSRPSRCDWRVRTPKSVSRSVTYRAYKSEITVKYRSASRQHFFGT
eukprot:scaffold4869_cov183-Amphora_coffeaeformis.AAC.5